MRIKATKAGRCLQIRRRVESNNCFLLGQSDAIQLYMHHNCELDLDDADLDLTDMESIAWSLEMMATPHKWDKLINIMTRAGGGGGGR
jgi:hypothetical protein